MESWIYGTISSLITTFFYWTIALIVIKVPRWDNLVSDPLSYILASNQINSIEKAAAAFKANSGFIIGFIFGFVNGAQFIVRLLNLH